MLKALKATYRNGDLVLQERLGSEWEGKTIDIFIEVQNTEDTKDKDKGAEVQAFLEKWQQQPAKLVEGYKFDRDELYDR